MLHLLLTYKYLIVFPLSILEGPIISVISGFLVTRGVFNLFLVYAIIVAADIIGDALVYFIGRFGKRFLKYFGVTEERLLKAEKYFEENQKKALLMSKFVHGIGVTGLFAAGVLRVPYKKYFTICSLASAGQYIILILAGVFFGHAYEVIGKYLNYYAAGVSVIVVGILFFIFFRKYKEKIR